MIHLPVRCNLPVFSKPGTVDCFRQILYDYSSIPVFRVKNDTKSGEGCLSMFIRKLGLHKFKVQSGPVQSSICVVQSSIQFNSTKFNSIQPSIKVQSHCEKSKGCKNIWKRSLKILNAASRRYFFPRHKKVQFKPEKFKVQSWPEKVQTSVQFNSKFNSMQP